MPSTNVASLIRATPYWPVVSDRVLRKVLPGLAISAFGEGMAVVAVSWLALQLAPVAERGTWVAIAAAAYTLPAAAGTLIFSRWMSGRSGGQLAGRDATLRAVTLAAIPALYAFGLLHLWTFVGLLAVSSLLRSWGSAGRFTLLADVLPAEHHLAGNAVVLMLFEFATIVGPPVAGLVIGWNGAAAVFALVALSYAVLAATYRLAAPKPDNATTRTQTSAAVSNTVDILADEPVAKPSQSAGFAVIWRDRTLAGLLALTFGFYFLFGPVYVALPLLVVDELSGSASTFAAYYAVFGVGAVTGGLLTGYLRRWKLWPTAIGIVFAFGCAMLPLGLPVPTAVAMASFGLAGVIWAPYPALCMALLQRSADRAVLPQVLAANGTVTVLSVPLGTILGGPLVEALGSRGTFILCGATLAGLGLLTGVLMLARRRSHGSVDTSADTRP